MNANSAETEDKLDINIIERLCLMTVDGGLSDRAALWTMGLLGTKYKDWLKEHPIND